jgi:ubiquinone/menaquinone biosynthesis C-methylase UbiE
MSAAVSPHQARAFAQHVSPTLLGVARRAVDIAALEDGQAVLDVAAGTGLAAFLAAERVGREGTVIGLDDSAAMRAVAEERAAAAGGSANLIRWQSGDPERLSYADESFDAVLCLQALPDYPRPDAVLEELRRVLVEGGRLVLTIWGARTSNEWIDLVERAVRPALPDLRRPFRLLQPSNLEALLQGAGFEEIESGRLVDRMRFQEVDGLWQWAAASREWGPLLGTLPETERERVRAALARSLAVRQRGGEAAVGREFVFARAIAPPSP